MDLQELLERVEAATGPNFQLERDLCAALEPERREYGLQKPPNYTHSLDSALSLLAVTLPGAAWKIARNQNGRCYAAAGYEGFQLHEGPTPALALIAALLKALIAQQAKD